MLGLEFCCWPIAEADEIQGLSRLSSTEHPGRSDQALLLLSLLILFSPVSTISPSLSCSSQLDSH